MSSLGELIADQNPMSVPSDEHSAPTVNADTDLAAQEPDESLLDERGGGAAARDGKPAMVRARRFRRFFGARPWPHCLGYVVLPGLALLLALGDGFLTWQDAAAHQAKAAAVQSVQAATESTIALLSYHPDTVEQELRKAGDRLTGSFKDDYAKLTADVVIPGSKQKHISATARVPAAAPVSAGERHAVVLLFIDQTIVIGGDPPTDSASSVRVTLDEVGDRWLISGFEPV